MLKRTLTSAILLFILFSQNSIATIIEVPADFATIQEAIDASSNNDTVLVAPGTYYENINYNGKTIFVTSHFLHDHDPQFIFSTIINGSQPISPDSASCVRIVDGQDSTAVFQGFTLTEGYGTIWTDPHGAGVYREGGGILTEFSSPTIQYNYIHHNEAILVTTGLVSAGGGGIRSGDGNPHIYNNVITHNQGHYGGGVVLNYATGVVRNNLIAYNTGGRDFAGAGLWSYAAGKSTVVNNTIIYNSSLLPGGGVYISSTSADLINNIIYGNTAPSDSQIYEEFGTVNVSYSLVEGGFAGTNIIDADPVLSGSFSYLHPTSPCIDAGDPDIAYSDILKPSTANDALWPGMLTTLCDIGAYGGPYAFPFEEVAILSDTSFGWVPFTVNFLSFSQHDAVSWDWDFGDGTTNNIEHPSHLFEVPGLHKPALTITTQDATISGQLRNPILCLADSMITPHDSIEPGTRIAFDIIVRNNVPISKMIIPIVYDGELNLAFDSISTYGCRTDYFESVNTIHADPGNKRLTVELKSSTISSLPELQPGYGPVLKLYTTVPNWATQGMKSDILVDGYLNRIPSFEGSLIDITPRISSGAIVAFPCCANKVGNVDCDLNDDVDIGDITALIDFLFINLQPLCCEDESNIDNDIFGFVDIGDLTALIDYLFINFTPLPDCR